MNKVKLIGTVLGCAFASSAAFAAPHEGIPGFGVHNIKSAAYERQMVEQVYAESIYPVILQIEKYYNAHPDAITLPTNMVLTMNLGSTNALGNNSPLQTLQVTNNGRILATFNTVGQGSAVNVAIPPALAGKVVVITPAAGVTIDGIDLGNSYLLGAGFTCTTNIGLAGASGGAGITVATASATTGVSLALAGTSLNRCLYNTATT